MLKVKLNNGQQIEIAEENAKYPKDICVFQTGQKTFSIVDNLTKRELEDDSPVKILDDSFARFVFTIISNGEGSLKANVDPGDIPDALKATDSCKFIQVQHDVTSGAGEGSTQNSPGFTKRFVTGNLKGKSPVEVLIENENGKALLNEQFKFLRDNLQKFPKNKELMDAIVDASKQDIEKLKERAAAQPTLKPYTILDVSERPLQRVQRADGKCFCYGCRVMWDFERKYPVTITITNYYAPVTRKENGTLNVAYSEKDDVKVYDYSLTAKQWIKAIDKMYRCIVSFENMYYPSAHELAGKIAAASAEAAKNKQ